MNDNDFAILEEKVLQLIEQTELLKIEKEDLELEISKLHSKNQILVQKIKGFITNLQGKIGEFHEFDNEKQD